MVERETSLNGRRPQVTESTKMSNNENEIFSADRAAVLLENSKEVIESCGISAGERLIVTNDRTDSNSRLNDNTDLKLECHSPGEIMSAMVYSEGEDDSGEDAATPTGEKEYDFYSPANGIRKAYEQKISQAGYASPLTPKTSIQKLLRESVPLRERRGISLPSVEIPSEEEREKELKRIRAIKRAKERRLKRKLNIKPS